MIRNPYCVSPDGHYITSILKDHKLEREWGAVPHCPAGACGAHVVIPVRFLTLNPFLRIDAPEPQHRCPCPSIPWTRSYSQCRHLLGPSPSFSWYVAYYTTLLYICHSQPSITFGQLCFTPRHTGREWIVRLSGHIPWMRPVSASGSCCSPRRVCRRPRLASWNGRAAPSVGV